MDDDESKIRRNLILFSSAVLILAWLGIPFSALIGKLVEARPQHLDDSKLWATGLAVLAYLAIRYRFSPEGEKFREVMKTDRDRLLLDKALALAQRQANYFTRTGCEPSVFSGNLIQHVADMSADMGDHIKNCGRPMIMLSISDYRDAPWDFSMVSDMMWFSEGEKVASTSGGSNIDVKIAGSYRLFVEAFAQLHALTYSASAIKYLAPVLLGLAATSVLAGKVLLAYLNL